MEAVVGSGADKRWLQEAQLHGGVPTELVQQGQGGPGHAHEALCGSALPFIESLLVGALPVQCRVSILVAVHSAGTTLYSRDACPMHTGESCAFGMDDKQLCARKGSPKSLFSKC